MKAGGQNLGNVDHPTAADPTHAKLLEAAGEVFARSGYYAATIREICTRAGANVASVNYHFGDKLKLYTEVLRQSFAPSEAIRKVFEQDAAPEEILRQVIRGMVQGICGDPSDFHLRLRAHELAQPTPAIARIIDESVRPIYDRLRETIAKILGLPRDHEKTRLCTHSVIGQVVHYAHAGPFLARLWPELKMTPEQLEQIANHIAEFSLAYLRAARSNRG